MQFHPLGHILVTASNDHTTRFWCRERPGDASSVFSGGGEKPPESTGQDEDEDAFVPGFASGWEDGAANNGPDAYAREQDDIPGFGGSGETIPGFDATSVPGPQPGRQNGASSGPDAGMYSRPEGEDRWGRGGAFGRGDSGYGRGENRGDGGGYNRGDGGGYSRGDNGYNNRGEGRNGGFGPGTGDSGYDGGGGFGSRGGRGGRWGGRRPRY